MLAQQVSSSKVVHTAVCPEPPLAWPDPTLVSQAANLIVTAMRPLVIVGKGNTYTQNTVPVIAAHFISQLS
jgi:TPP-dependent trihydroxycyclohexane-1,2-dione (THcHDO) dehydratase